MRPTVFSSVRARRQIMTHVSMPRQTAMRREKATVITLTAKVEKIYL